MILVYLIVGTLGITLLGLLALRLWDARAEQAEWAGLAALQPANPSLYDPMMVAASFTPIRKPGRPMMMPLA